MSADAEALSALLGERSDRQLRVLMATIFAAPQMAHPIHPSVNKIRHLEGIALGGLAMADIMLQLAESNPPGTLQIKS